jgi:HSP20 family protein
MSFNDIARFRNRINRIFNEFDRSFGGNDPFFHDTDLMMTDTTTTPPLLSGPSNNTGTGQQQTSGGTPPSSTAMTTTPQQQTGLSLFGEQPGWFRNIAPIRADVVESDKEIAITADIPGMTKEEVKINIDPSTRVMTISGERKHEKIEPAPESKDSKEPHTTTQQKSTSQQFYRRYERSFGSVQRSFNLPPNVDTSKINAKYENGVLKISVPKQPSVKPQQIHIS